MRKDLGPVGRAAGLFLVSAGILQGCGSSTPLPPAVSSGGMVTTEVSPRAEVPPRHCNPSQEQLPKSVSDTIATRFAEIVRVHSRLSASERDALFIDRDVKGNRISYRRA